MMVAAHRPPACRSCGFTLIEVLVAMMIMALLAVMAWQGVNGITRTRDSSQSKLDQSLRLNTVLAQWEQDLAALQETPAGPSSLSFDGINLRMVRRTPAGLQLVIWSLRPSEQSGQSQLLRWTSEPMTLSSDLRDAWTRSQQFVGTEPGQLRTLGGISEWQIYFFRGNGWSNAQSSGDTETSENTPAPGTRREALPTGIRLAVTFAEGGGRNGSLIRDIALSPQWLQ